MCLVGALLRDEPACPARLLNRVSSCLLLCSDGRRDEQWTVFNYTVSDKSAVSVAGLVWVVPSHHNIVYSGFNTNLDGWSVWGNGNIQAALPAGGLSYEPYSRGVLNHYIIGTDVEINTNLANNDDLMRWYFVAPAKFMGMQIIAYGGSLRFSWASAAGTDDDGQCTAIGYRWWRCALLCARVACVCGVCVAWWRLPWGVTWYTGG